MKYLLLALLLPVFASAQPLLFTDVVTVDSTSKDELYYRAKEWFASTFRDSKAVIESDDKTAGVIIGKGNSKYECNEPMAGPQVNGIIRYQIKLLFKDGRYKYELTNFRHEGTANHGYSAIDFGLITKSETSEHNEPMWGKKMENSVWNDIKSKSSIEANAIIASLTKAMGTPSGVTSNDW